MTEIRCAHCGWRNEPTARMCGGCGRPLRAFGSSGASAIRGSSLADMDVTDPDMPTVADLPPLAQPVGQSRTRTAPSRVDWQSAPRPGARRGSVAGRVALIGLALFALLFICACGAWAAAIRPRLHQQVDTALRAQFGDLVATANQASQLASAVQQPIPTITFSIPAGQVTQDLRQQLPSDVPVKNPHVSFSGGRAVLSFTTYGGDGAISTALAIRNGRLFVTATEVDGSLALIESGSELQQAINDALGNVRSDISVKQVTLDKDVMTVTVKGA